MVLNKSEINICRELILQSDSGRPASKQIIIDLMDTIEAQQQEIERLNTNSKSLECCMDIMARKDKEIEQLKVLLKCSQIETGMLKMDGLHYAEFRENKAIQTLLNKIEQLKKMLRQLEWITEDEGSEYCPVCKGQIHEENCELAVLLKDGEDNDNIR